MVAVGDRGLLFRTREMAWLEEGSQPSVGSKGLLVNTNAGSFFLDETSIASGDNGRLINLEKIPFVRGAPRRCNQLLNPSFESGNTSGWSIDGEEYWDVQVKNSQAIDGNYYFYALDTYGYGNFISIYQWNPDLTKKCYLKSLTYWIKSDVPLTEELETWSSATIFAIKQSGVWTDTWRWNYPMESNQWTNFTLELNWDVTDIPWEVYCEIQLSSEFVASGHWFAVDGVWIH